MIVLRHNNLIITTNERNKEMKITYSVWQGSIIKGAGFTASSMKDVAKTIDELNELGTGAKFEAFISNISQEVK